NKSVRFWLHWCCTVLCCVYRSSPINVSAGEGDNVTLSCYYSTSYSDVSLYWYRQFPGQGPQYVLRIDANAYKSVRDLTEFAKKRFTPQAVDSSTALNITALEPTDTAVYYCALRLAQ
uniref:Ig-like domain-containing protein n=1 Tax=Chrysemys picta bellii TaxID=8478 RepID=A0A8C3IG13_CHRPI